MKEGNRINFDRKREVREFTFKYSRNKSTCACSIKNQYFQLIGSITSSNLGCTVGVAKFIIWQLFIQTAMSAYMIRETSSWVPVKRSLLKGLSR